MNGTHIVSVAYLTGHIDGPCTVITLEGPCYRTFEVYNKANDGEVWTIRKYVDPECVVNEIEWPVDRVTAGSMVRLLNMWRKFR